MIWPRWFPWLLWLFTKAKLISNGGSSLRSSCRDNHRNHRGQINSKGGVAMGAATGIARGIAIGAIATI